MLEIGGWKFNAASRTLIHGDYSIQLTKTESKLFELFSSNLDIIVSREDILSAVWGKSDYHTGRCMDVYICKLRKILARYPSLKISSFRGLGYKLTLAQ
tara:strand:+ start:384 stop:680 length:297 start_codon:yes stop_codon:yes gene_type:complete